MKLVVYNVPITNCLFLDAYDYASYIRLTHTHARARARILSVSSKTFHLTFACLIFSASNQVTTLLLLLAGSVLFF